MIHTDGRRTIANAPERMPREELVELVANHPSDEVLAELLVRYGIDEVDVFRVQLENL